ncbi:DNA-directed RNA polymerase subunit RPC12/RpoP [Streptomyces aurantiacus]|uniref:hypothetical protein n=1 Tax=Streptomyces aurantiacus TaxID=47760 RepID=UPI0027947525|nr:hypothetical protein [Streptomyces aurantiacus]MDQ0776590.1 DNA-directed RNA polymerase subunit RPC12/RpoP [Streptomyces aurantiacus]
MTRPAVRMCARCHRTTSSPVLVHEVHAATGPGFNVYACSECADQYPPMTDVLELLEPSRRRSRLTLRVYTVDRQGAVTRERSRVEVRVGDRGDPLPLTSAYPPCGCPRCGTPEHSTAPQN